MTEQPNNYAQKSMINITGADASNLSIIAGEYALSAVMDDILFVKYVDGNAGEKQLSSGLIMAASQTKNLWRVGKVILAGPKAKVVPGALVIFPNNLGITIKDLTIVGEGVVPEGIFLNENRLFGVAERLETQS